MSPSLGVGAALAGAQPAPGVLAEDGTYAEYENDLGITATALYDYQAGEARGGVGRGGGAPVSGNLASLVRVWVVE